MEALSEEQTAEAQKERKLRERNEQYSRQLEEELEGLKVSWAVTSPLIEFLHIYQSEMTANTKVPDSWKIKPQFLSPATKLKHAGSSTIPASADQSQEVGRLRGDLEKKTLLYEEELTRREGQHNSEMKTLRKELRDAESQHLTLQKEILMLKDKLEKTRRERYFFILCWFLILLYFILYVYMCENIIFLSLSCFPAMFVWGQLLHSSIRGIVLIFEKGFYELPVTHCGWQKLAPCISYNPTWNNEITPTVQWLCVVAQELLLLLSWYDYF